MIPLRQTTVNNPVAAIRDADRDIVGTVPLALGRALLVPSSATGALNVEKHKRSGHEGSGSHTSGGMSMITVARLALAALFAVAGIAKLADRQGSRKAAGDFGVPESLVGPTAIVLPLLELALAAGLLPAQSARPAAICAAALLGLFATLIAVAVVRRRSVDCHCFGQLHSAPAGWRSVGRNAGLTAAALFVASQPAGAFGWIEVAAIGIGIVLGLALLLFVLLRRYGAALARIDELTAGREREIVLPRVLEQGSVAPDFELVDLRGGRISLSRLVALARPVLLVFSSPGCGACHALLPRVAEWQRDRLEQVTVAVVVSGDRAENAALAEEHGLRLVLVQDGEEIAQLYGIEATPSAVLVGPDGAVAHALVAGAGAVEELLESIAPSTDTVEAPSIAAAVSATPHRALAGRVATTALLAAAAAAATPAFAARLTDPELGKVAATLRKAGPRLTAAARRSSSAVRAQAVLQDGTAQRAKRTAAVQALAAERRGVLALRSEIKNLDLKSVTAGNARAMVLVGLALLASSLEQQRKALTAQPKAALTLLDHAQKAYLSSLASLADAAKVVGDGA
jgi:peroxiredoxin/uncharacterized membrane protein YphA (DoxX/SURF4 family)